MKVTEQDIVRTARQLRDEENEQLNVSPWNSHLHPHRSSVFANRLAWLVALPAAVIVGFVLGIWTQARTQGDSPLTALVDTIYIKVPTPQHTQDTIAQAVPAVSAPAHRQTSRPSKASRRQEAPVGRPVADDHIRYDLLVKN